MNSQVPYSARVQAGGFFLCHALTPTFSGSSGLFHLSSAYTVAKGRTSMNLDRNPKDLDASTHGLNLAYGITDKPAARSFALVNKLLEGAKSQERAYAIYRGAALSVIFLTDDLIAVMKADPVAVPKFIPYRPTTDFPFFGQPQQ